MFFLDKLDETYNLMNDLGETVIKANSNAHLKKQLLIMSENLSRYKDINQPKLYSNNDKINSKITDILNKINEIEINVRNKIIITEKYNAYLNS